MRTGRLDAAVPCAAVPTDRRFALFEAFCFPILFRFSPDVVAVSNAPDEELLLPASSPVFKASGAPNGFFSGKPECSSMVP